MDFTEIMESSILEMKENLANGKLTKDTDAEVYLQYNNNYIVFGKL